MKVLLTPTPSGIITANSEFLVELERRQSLLTAVLLCVPKACPGLVCCGSGLVFSVR